MLTCLIFLDYSRAFDTLNHSLVLATLDYIGFSYQAVDFYLSIRSQHVKIQNKLSDIVFVAKKACPKGQY